MKHYMFFIVALLAQLYIALAGDNLDDPNSRLVTLTGPSHTPA